ncbi:hypothetical protein ACEPPN_017575 [Leptodophora sp. 'Broadleaf-Isolate-01']
MAPSTYKYSYTSQLPFMFTLIGMVCKSKPGNNGFTEEQIQLWTTVIENRDRVLQSSPHRDDDPAIQQYILEMWTWNRYWPERPFPGSKPNKIEAEAFSSTEYASPLNVEPNCEPGNDMFTPPNSSPPAQRCPFNIEPRMYSRNDMLNHPPSPTCSYPVIQPPSKESLYAECREAILQHKGADHIPYHGLPRYSIICTASNGFLVFCGPQQEYFRVLKTHFFSTARIMYQRARTGLMIIWIEAPTYNHAIEFRTNKKMWNEFRSCWAFLKCWADAAGEGPADNIADFLQGWQPDVSQFENLQLPFPPLQVYRQYNQKDGDF